LAFVNSAYGDNHDHAVMPILTALEFANSAPHLEKAVVGAVFEIGAGPDSVFEALIDESRVDLGEIHARTWKRAGRQLEAFARDLFGQIDGDETALLKAALENTLDEAALAHLRSLPLAEFLFDLKAGARQILRGALARTLATSLIPASPPLPQQLTQVRGMRLLVCSANPDFDLDLDQEVRAIRQVAEASPQRGTVVIESILAVTPDDFVATLRQFRPTAVHFSGHGNVDGIVMRGDGDAIHVITGEALAQALQGRGVDLVVLNACYSDCQALAVAPNVGAIIGTRRSLEDEAAIRFSKAFYRTLLAGEALEAALKDGKDAVVLYNLDDVYASHGDLSRSYA
jgi:hypothetical protein